MCLFSCCLSHPGAGQNCTCHFQPSASSTHLWLCFQTYSMCQHPWTGIAGQYRGKRPGLELLIWPCCWLTGNIWVPGSVPPVAARNSIASSQVSQIRVQCEHLLAVPYTHHSSSTDGVKRFECCSAPFTPQDCRETANCSGTSPAGRNIPWTPNFADLGTHMNKKNWSNTVNKRLWHGNFIARRYICFAVHLKVHRLP